MSKATMWVLAGAAATVAWGAMAADAAAQLDEKYRPKLFKQFGDHVNTPDGLTQD